MRTYDEIMADADQERVFSNSTEYEIWANNGRGCYDCTQDDAETEKYCPILGAALMGVWPKEWERRDVPWEINGTTGVYQTAGECSEFEERDDWPGDDDPEDGPPPPPDPPAVIVGQLDIFGVFADQAITKLTEEVPAHA